MFITPVYNSRNALKITFCIDARESLPSYNTTNILF